MSLRSVRKNRAAGFSPDHHLLVADDRDESHGGLDAVRWIKRGERAVRWERACDSEVFKQPAKSRLAEEL